jgi:anti-sigma-K factor RskA
MGSPAPVFLAQLETDGSLQVRPLAPVQVAAGRDLELWALPEGAKAPVSLGVLPAIGRRLPPRQAFRGPVQLLVSLEPTGGSPSGQPTGPLLYGGALKRL